MPVFNNGADEAIGNADDLRARRQRSSRERLRRKEHGGVAEDGCHGDAGSGEARGVMAKWREEEARMGQRWS